MKLVVDVGNSRVKWALAEGRRLSAHGAAAYSADAFRAALEQAWSTLPRPDAVFVASVVGAEWNEAVGDLAAVLWKSQPVFLQSEATAGALTNAYKDCRRLGIDRWAAMVGALSRYRPPLCVLDVGTAATVDVIDGHSRHRGGYIIPGPRAAGLWLRETAPGLSETKLNMPTDNHTTEFGLSTPECIANGYAAMLTGFIRQAVEQARSAVGGEIKLIVTGGGAAAAASLLPADYLYDEHLVLRGIACLADSRS